MADVSVVGKGQRLVDAVDNARGVGIRLLLGDPEGGSRNCTGEVVDFDAVEVGK